ncbi:DUF1036 domain-containing protein [Bacillus sp. ME78]|uniref:DUF1036 domain-containing protein n=1 Tax=Bacillus sp. ME78 TaxID=2744261 RepID=UPI001602ABA6|nr:DUF1036 domain-containing protein [Bacillus sp. ME78]
MPLTFRNDTSLTLEVAIAFYDRSCTGSQWRKKGWWQIPPRGQVTVFGEKAKNKKFFFFARSTNNAQYVWKGDMITSLPNEVFSRCWDESGGAFYEMRNFIATADDYTYPLYI